MRSVFEATGCDCMQILQIYINKDAETRTGGPGTISNRKSYCRSPIFHVNMQ